jgi:hypothetical protein
MISGFPFSFLATASDVFKHYDFVELKASKRRFCAVECPIFFLFLCASKSNLSQGSGVIAFTAEASFPLFGYLLTLELARALGGVYSGYWLDMTAWFNCFR